MKAAFGEYGGVHKEFAHLPGRRYIPEIFRW
jgi:hypothetical protein